MAAGSIVIELLMKTGSFITDSDRASKRLKQFEKEAKEAGTAIGVAVSAAVTATAALLKNSIDAMDDLSKAAQRANTTTEEFSKLAYGAGLADVAIEDLQTSLGRLAKAQAAALDPATQQAKVFSALGISITDAAGNLRDTTDVFKDFADVFEQQKGSPEIIAAGMAVFGKSFQTLIPLLKDGSAGLKDAADEAAAFGQVVSTEAGANAEQFNDNLDRMRMFVTGVANAVAADLLPDLVNLQEGFLDGARDGEKLHSIAEDIANTMRVLAGAIEFAMIPLRQADNFIQGTTIALQGLFEAAKGVIGLNWDQISRGLNLSGEGAWTAVFGTKLSNETSPSRANFSGVTSTVSGTAVDRAAIAEQKKRADELKKLRDEVFGPDSKSSGSGSSGRSEAEKAADQLASAYESINKQLDETIALQGNSSAAAKLAYDLQSGELAGLTQAQKDSLTQKQAQVDLLEAEKAAQEEVNEQSKEYAEQVERQNKAFEDHKADLLFELDLLGKSNKERQREIELRYLGADATDEQRAAIGELSDQLYDESKAMQESIDLQDDFRSGFADMFKDILDGSKSAKDALLDFVDSIEARLSERIANNFADWLFGEQGQNGGGKSGDWISSIASLFSSGSGGSSSGSSDWTGTIASLFSSGSSFGGAFATGGDPLPGKAYLVGEDGPEMFVPRTAGRVYDSGTTQAMIGGGTRGLKQQVINMTVQGRVDRRTEAQIAQEVGRRTQVAMGRNG